MIRMPGKRQTVYFEACLTTQDLDAASTPGSKGDVTLMETGMNHRYRRFPIDIERKAGSGPRLASTRSKHPSLESGRPLSRPLRDDKAASPGLSTVLDRQADGVVDNPQILSLPDGKIVMRCVLQHTVHEPRGRQTHYTAEGGLHPLPTTEFFDDQPFRLAPHPLGK